MYYWRWILCGGMKTVYVYETANKDVVSPYFQKRNDALAWNRENKDKQVEMIFLMKREITKKSFNEYFGIN